MRQMSRWMEMIHQTIGWRRDEHGTDKHAHGSWILWSVSRVRSKTKHSLSCMLHRFEIFSAPGTIAHGSIRLPPRSLAASQPRSLASSRDCSLAISGIGFNTKTIVDLHTFQVCHRRTVTTVRYTAGVTIVYSLSPFNYKTRAMCTRPRIVYELKTIQRPRSGRGEGSLHFR